MAFLLLLLLLQPSITIITAASQRIKTLLLLVSSYVIHVNSVINSDLWTGISASTHVALAAAVVTSIAYW